MADTERVELPKGDRGPNGGVVSIIYYQDDQGDPVDKSKATRAEILEFNSQDQVVGRTYMDIKS